MLLLQDNEDDDAMTHGPGVNHVPNIVAKIHFDG
jgi:hypothetical protein